MDIVCSSDNAYSQHYIVLFETEGKNREHTDNCFVVVDIVSDYYIGCDDIYKNTQK